MLPHAMPDLIYCHIRIDEVALLIGKSVSVAKVLEVR
jgi:hypothetical protein